MSVECRSSGTTKYLEVESRVGQKHIEHTTLPQKVCTLNSMLQMYVWKPYEISWSHRETKTAINDCRWDNICVKTILQLEA